MKTLLAINAVQLACLLVLIFMLATANSVEMGTVPVKVNGGEAVAGSMATDRQHAMTGLSSGGLDTSQLRQIIREELQAFARTGRDRETGQSTGMVGMRERKTTEDEYRADFVEQQIEYYRSVGEITPLQMQDLQAEIAKLDHASRKNALSSLIRAMNAGEIRGHL